MTKSITAKHINEALEFRHACKKFDINKKISDDDIELLLQAARLAPSSYGMEQWNIIVAQDAKLRTQLKKSSSIVNGSRFDASYILVFTAKTASGFDRHMTHMLRDVKGANVVTVAAMKAGWKH